MSISHTHLATMNDDDYAAALRQELESLIRECEDARAARNKGRLLVEHLKAEHSSLQAQKDQRLLRIRLLNELDVLQKQAEDKKQEKMRVVAAVVAAQQRYNQLLVEASRSLPEAMHHQPVQEQEQTRKSKTRYRQQQKMESISPPQNFEPYWCIHEKKSKPPRPAASQSTNDNAREKVCSQMTLPKEPRNSNSMDLARDQKRMESSSSGEMSIKTSRRQATGQRQQQQQQQQRRAARMNNSKNGNDKSSAVTEEEEHHHHGEHYSSAHDHGSSRRPISSALLNDQMNANEKKDLANFMSACGYHSPSEE
jgi:hypothetical protein